MPEPESCLFQQFTSSVFSTKVALYFSTNFIFNRCILGLYNHKTKINAVIVAAATTMRLQTIISREVAPIENAVLTIGALQAGTKENIIPEDATLKLNIRTFNDGVRDHILSAVKRICCAECTASNAPREPEFTMLDSYPLTATDRKNPRIQKVNRFA